MLYLNSSTLRITTMQGSLSQFACRRLHVHTPAASYIAYTAALQNGHTTHYSSCTAELKINVDREISMVVTYTVEPL